MSCDNPLYVIPSTVLVGEDGATGAKGDKGDTGAGASNTSQVTHDGNERNGENLADLIDELFYILIAINTFAAGTLIYELGTTVASIAFSWTYNKAVVTAQQIDGPQVATGPLDVALRAHTATGLTITADSTYTLTSNDGSNPAVKTLDIEFWNKFYWGARTSGTIDSAFILSLSNSELKDSKSKTLTVTAGSNDYIYIAYPKRFGTSIFIVGGFEGGFQAPLTVSFTNSEGYTEDYYVYRSTNLNLGTTTVEGI